MRKVTTLILLAGFIFYLATVAGALFAPESPTILNSVGTDIIQSSQELSGSANTVTAVVVQYRGLDTLGEVTVLFVSALGVALLAGSMRDGVVRELFTDDGGFVLQTGSRVLLPFIVLIGVYIIMHGHLSPGGGFPGGVVIATAVFVVILTSVEPRVPHRLTSVLEGLAGLSFVGLGIAGILSSSNSFLANILPLGTYGSLFSAGLIPVLYGVVGVKVAGELTNVVAGLTDTIAHTEGGAE